MMIRACLDAIKRGRAAHIKGTAWDTNHIAVHFMDGSFQLQRRVWKVAKQWSDISGIMLVPATDKHKSDLRVTFSPGGSWSFVGTQALDISTKEPTMQLGWLTEDSEDEELQQVVLHEFGHAMGLIHEHQNPTQGILWDKERVYAFYMGYPHYWSKAQVDTNVFEKYSKDVTQFTEFDPTSIMLYPIPAEFTHDGFSVDWNLGISDMDKKFIQELYKA